MSTPSKKKLGLLRIFVVTILLLMLAIRDSPAKQTSTICAKASPDTLFRGVTVAIGQDSTQCITITNCGDTTVAFDAYTSLGDYSVSPKTSPPLPPDSSFTFCVTFKPKNVGNKHGFLFISAGFMQLYIPVLAGTPCAQLSAAPLSFGLVIAGQTVQKSVEIFNNGDYLWKPGTGYFFPDKGVFSISTPNWDSVVIPAHQSVSLTISYSPKTIETDTATLSFPDAGPCGNDLRIPVSGEGGCAVLSRQWPNVPNTGVGETSQFTGTISNSGNIDWNSGVGMITGKDSSAYRLVSVFPSVIPAGKQWAVTIDFTPKASGHYTAQLIFTNSGPCGNFSPVDLSAEAACAKLTPEQSILQQVTIGHTGRFTVGIKNTGILNWTAGTPIIAGTGSSAFTLISITPDSIAPGGNAVLTFDFTPTGNTYYSATVTFPNSSHCQSSPVIIYLKGQGLVDGVKATSTDAIYLEQNYPNPFSAETSFEYTTPAETEIRLTLNDISGRVIKTIVKGRVSEGKHLVHLSLGELPEGAYFLLLESGVTKSMRVLTLVK